MSHIPSYFTHPAIAWSHWGQETEVLLYEHEAIQTPKTKNNIGANMQNT